MDSSNFMLPSGSEVFPFSQTYQGIGQDWQKKLMSSVMPQLTDSVNNMSGNIDSYLDNSMKAYGQQLQDTLKTNIPKTVTNLANRGVLDSSTASNAISRTQQSAYKNYADQGYQAALQAALLKLKMPEVLTNIAGLGQYATKYDEDKTALYQTLAQMLMYQM